MLDTPNTNTALNTNNTRNITNPMEFDLFLNIKSTKCTNSEMSESKQMRNTVKGGYWKCDTTLVGDLCSQLYGQHSINSEGLPPTCRQSQEAGCSM